MFRTVIQSIERWIIPPTCLLCGNKSSTQQDLCLGCKEDLPRLHKPCLQCALPLKQAQLICGQCTQEPPPFTVTHALYHYETPIPKLISDLKFQHQLVCARALGELLAGLLEACYAQQPLPDVIIPVPLHVKRLQERGFNQAVEIARPIAKILSRP